MRALPRALLGSLRRRRHAPHARRARERRRGARRDGRAFAITAKSEPHSHRCLETVGLELDGVVGHVHGDEKAAALRELAAQIYVGDTIADVRAGVAANVISIGVTTGMHDAQELGDAGADRVFASLDEFPAWLAAH